MPGMMRWSTPLALAACVSLAAASAALAGEVPAPPPAVSPSALLLLSNTATAPAAQEQQLAFDESIKRPGPAARPPAGEVQPDGTVRYGPVTMSVKNPCPPGEHLDEPRPLPGRRARK